MSQFQPNVSDTDIYTYPVSATIPANGTSTITINIESDSLFTWYKTTSFIAGYVPQSDAEPNITVEINDTGSGRLLEQSPVHIRSMSGSGQLPFILDHPRDFKPNSSVRFKFTNNEGTAKTVQLNLHGIKSWQFGGNHAR